MLRRTHLMSFVPAIFLLGLSLLPGILHGSASGSSAPYISGDTFRAVCDFVYDEWDRSLDPLQVQEGDVIFLKTDFLEEFFHTVHSKIMHRYILVTHNGDYPVPRGCGHYLDDEKLIAWFGQNVENAQHDKLFPIPIGIANRCWSHGDVDQLNEAIETAQHAKRKILLYMNFARWTHASERDKVYNLFKDKPFCTHSLGKDFPSYLKDLNHSKFVLSPRGGGLDCHRTWEALLMGAIPIVHSCSLDPLFEDLPVLIIDDWEEINEQFLDNKYQEIRSKSYNMEKIYADYWIRLIFQKKKDARVLSEYEDSSNGISAH